MYTPPGIDPRIGSRRFETPLEVEETGTGFCVPATENVVEDPARMDDDRLVALTSFVFVESELREVLPALKAA